MHAPRFLVPSILFALVLALPSLAHAQALLSSMTIEQTSASQLGTWTLIYGDGTSLSSADEGIDPIRFTSGLSKFGPVVLRVNSPSGVVARISVYRGNEFVTQTDSQQFTFELFPNIQYRFVVQYRLAQLGTLGVISDIQGIVFRVKSLGGRTYRGKTPWSRMNLPVGDYTVYSNPAPGCFRPAPLNVKVEAEKRNIVTISQTCENAKDDITVERVRPSKRSLVEGVTIREAQRR